MQGGHLPGKPGKVREFQSGQGKVRESKIARLLAYSLGITPLKSLQVTLPL